MMKPPRKQPEAPAKPLLFYFAHPYSGDIEANMKSCIEKTNLLLDKGFVVFNPLTHFHYLDMAKNRAPDFWYNLDLQIMDRMDGIILAPGWEESRGCLMEFGFFLGAKKPVLHYDELMNPKPVP